MGAQEDESDGSSGWITENERFDRTFEERVKLEEQ